MAKTNFQYEKRQKDLEKKRKKEEKLKKKADKASSPEGASEDASEDVETEAGLSEDTVADGKAIASDSDSATPAV